MPEAPDALSEQNSAINSEKERLSTLEVIKAETSSFPEAHAILAESVKNQVHHNVEQRLKSLGQEWEGRLAACCQRDANGNYHAGAALLSEKGLLRAYASSSTYLGLVEALKGRLG